MVTYAKAKPVMSGLANASTAAARPARRVALATDRPTFCSCSNGYATSRGFIVDALALVHLFVGQSVPLECVFPKKTGVPSFR